MEKNKIVDDLQKKLEEEYIITRVLKERLSLTKELATEEHEALAYRFAQLLTAAKSLYLEILPRITNAQDGDELWDLLVEVRMNLLHIRDLVEDYEACFLGAMERICKEKQ